MYCANHRLENMTDVKNKRCAYPECKKQKTFNYEGQVNGLYCADHRLENMVDVKSKRCAYPDCKTRPAFNYEGQLSGLYCAEHRLESMVNVKDKRCANLECKKLPWYGVPGKTATHCAEHKTSGQIPYSKRKCQIDGCKKFAFYGITIIPTHCEEHYDENIHYNLVQKECITCFVLDCVDNEQKCSRCSEYLSKRLHLRKQRQVKMWIDNNRNLPKYLFYDRPLTSEPVCGKERPDFTFDCGTHLVILEVDEYQHKNYQSECELIRMKNITNASTMPCIWIRYNPDEFKGCTLKITEKYRCELLLKVLSVCMSMQPQSTEDFLRVAYLFYDGFKLGIPIEYNKISLY
jgi:hypothetical protein